MSIVERRDGRSAGPEDRAPTTRDGNTTGRPADAAGVDRDLLHKQHLEDADGWREGRITFRVRIGVTGHRDPVRSPELQRLIRTQLESIGRAVQGTGQTCVCFTLVSSLAEGSDRLVVSEALGLWGEDRVELQAVLPLETDEYRKDFERDESKDEFDGLLAKASSVAPVVHVKDRDTAYERAGRWVVDHSDVVIALWNGRPAEGRGGTAEIVRYAHLGGVPVLVVPTTRMKEPDRKPREVESSRNLFKDLREAREALRRIDQFNRGSIKDPKLVLRIGDADARLGAAADGTSVYGRYAQVAEWALPRLARADLLAMRYQRRYYALGIVLYGLAALAVTVVAFQSQFNHNSLFALPEVLFMVLLVGIVWMGRRVQALDRWVGYRSLAEAFRSAVFILMTGAPVRTDKPIDEQSLGEEPWFQRAFSEAWKERPQFSAESAEHVGALKHKTADLRRFVVEGWIDDQIRYHRDAESRYRRRRVLLTRTIVVLFGMTVLVGVLHSFELVPGKWWLSLFVFLAVALPGFGAAITGIRDQRQFRLHEHRSARTARRLELLKRNMESQTNLAAVQKLAARIQRVIEGENFDWSGVIEFQDLEMVI